MPSDIKPCIRYIHSAGIREKKNKEYCGGDDIYRCDNHTDLFFLSFLCFEAKTNSCHQERKTGKIMIDICSSRDKNPGKILSEYSNDNKEIPCIAESGMNMPQIVILSDPVSV